MRALGRFRWLLPAVAIPACAVAAGIVLQAAAFGRAPQDSLLATQALRGLVDYRVMRGTESLLGRRLETTCIEGWFRLPGRRLEPGALVLLGNGERLFDVGRGVRRVTHGRHSRGAGREDRARFLLAGCPRYLGDRFATDLTRGRSVEAVDERSDGTGAAAIIVGSRHVRLTLATSRHGFKPLALTFRDGPLRGTSDLVPGGGAPAIRRVRHAFGLAARRHGRA